MRKKINSRAKGANGEREFSHWLQDHGVQARRGQQFAGGHESPDVVHDLPNIHFEVKRCETLSLYKAMGQACRDKRVTDLPVVAHRRNGEEWLIVMRASDWIRLVVAENARYDDLIG